MDLWTEQRINEELQKFQIRQAEEIQNTQRILRDLPENVFRLMIGMCKTAHLRSKKHPIWYAVSDTVKETIGTTDEALYDTVCSLVQRYSRNRRTINLMRKIVSSINGPLFSGIDGEKNECRRYSD